MVSCSECVDHVDAVDPRIIFLATHCTTMMEKTMCFQLRPEVGKSAVPCLQAEQ